MSAEPQSTKLPLCPMCYKAEMQSVILTERFDYHADGRVFPIVVEHVPVRLCPACGETVSGPDAGRVRDAAICKALGLLTPTEIRGLREQMGLSQPELAQLTGISETSIARWERGQAIQDRALDRFLRLLALQPASLTQLARMAADHGVNGTAELAAEATTSGV